MKRPEPLKLFFVCLLFPFILYAGSFSIQKRKTIYFESISIKSDATIYILSGEKNKIEMFGPDSILSLIKTNVNGKLLSVSSSNANASAAKIYITTNALKGITSSGNGDIVVKNFFESDGFAIDMKSSGNVTAMIDTKHLKVTLSGKGNLTVVGRANESEIRISGSGSMDGKKLVTFRSDISISGSGSSTVDVNNDLTVNITGSGNVYYLTSPERIYSRILGMGKIEKIG